MHCALQLGLRCQEEKGQIQVGGQEPGEHGVEDVVNELRADAELCDQVVRGTVPETVEVDNGVQCREEGAVQPAPALLDEGMERLRDVRLGYSVLDIMKDPVLVLPSDNLETQDTVLCEVHVCLIENNHIKTKQSTSERPSLMLGE